jgi:hypothetical protein
MKTVKTLVASAIFALLANTANADVLHRLVMPGNFLTNFTTTQFLPLSAGTYEIGFWVPTTGLVDISYNAECAANSTTADSWVGIEILVDNVVVAPSSPYKAFCSSKGSSKYDWGSATSTVAPWLTAGFHKAKVRASYIGSGFGWIGDAILTVTR